MSLPPIKTSEKLYSPMKSPLRAESPTTVRPLEMDDDDILEIGSTEPEPTSARVDAPQPPKKGAGEVDPPPKPPRPLDPQQQAENTLTEAFPGIELGVIKAILIASSGDVERAFHALLFISDPARDRSPPPPPVRPTAPESGSTPLSQLLADEQYARQLAQQDAGDSRAGWKASMNPKNRSGQVQGAPHRSDRPSNVPERNFIDDELPIIKDNLKKGLLETQNKVAGWITTLKKKIDGDDENDNMPYGYGSTSRPRRSYEDGRTSDYNRYDADPQVLGDDLGGIQLNPDGIPLRNSVRQPVRQNQSKPLVSEKKASESISASPKATFTEENDIYHASPRADSKKPPKQSKWQPLSTIEPSSIGETEHDPFSLGDSDDEKDVKDRFGGKLKKSEDSDTRQKNDAGNLTSDVTESTRKLEISEKVRGDIDEKKAAK
ncbi:hypothetical protein K3495_g6832 [Podosphaera aphanis]|nr:hypothetical protein K3495_g6832 [Podosphaera aphanis]